MTGPLLQGRELVPARFVWRPAMNNVPRRGLNRSLPKDADLGTAISIRERRRALKPSHALLQDPTYLNEMPYCATCSYPDFQTRVTSQALVACNLHDRKAETAFPPTRIIFISSISAMARRSVLDARAPHPQKRAAEPGRCDRMEIREEGWRRRRAGMGSSREGNIPKRSEECSVAHVRGNLDGRRPHKAARHGQRTMSVPKGRNREPRT